jgi:hypothetical protein
MSQFHQMKDAEIIICHRDLKILEIVSKAYFDFDCFVACYFASLMQVLFHLPNLTEKLFAFNTHNFQKHFDKIEESKDIDVIEKKKLLSSKKLVEMMQHLWAAMLLSNVKYQDPTKVLENIVDDQGQNLSIYEQKDIGEFFLNFLERM